MIENKENNEILDRILETMKKRGVRQKDLTKHLGITETAFTRWKYAGSSSYLKYIDSIAKYLNVPVDYLMYGTVDKGHTKPIDFEDLEILNAIADMTPSEKDFIRNTIQFIQMEHISNNPLR